MPVVVGVRPVPPALSGSFGATGDTWGEPSQPTLHPDALEGESQPLVQSESQPLALAEPESRPVTVGRPQGKSGPDDPDSRSQDILKLTLDRLAMAEIPETSNRPAPPALPSQGDITLPRKKRPMAQARHVGERTSALQRMVNSSVGRALIASCTLAIFNFSCWSLADWNRPGYWEKGEQRYRFGAACAVFLSMYVLPLIAERAGMSATETGWKPYFVFYRVSFLTAIPAAILQGFGTGGRLAHGAANSSPSVTSLESVYWSYFTAKDGFVALNLTKGVVETLTHTEHGSVEAPRKSRFRDAELLINTEPWIEQIQPTVQPGQLAVYRVAPIFETWAPCVSRYRISGACLQQNPVQGWALAGTMSLCTEIGFVACRPPKPRIEPVYKCDSGDPVYGAQHTEPIQGLCGRVSEAPPGGAIDELRALFLEDGWPVKALPSADFVWTDLRPDECIGDTASCAGTWQSLYLAGFAFQIITNLFIIVPMMIDCRVDYKIREARRFFVQDQRKSQAPNAV